MDGGGFDDDRYSSIHLLFGCHIAHLYIVWIMHWWFFTAAVLPQMLAKTSRILEGSDLGSPNLGRRPRRGFRVKLYRLP